MNGRIKEICEGSEKTKLLNTTCNCQSYWHVSEIQILLYLPRKISMDTENLLMIQFPLFGFISWRVS
jgi:hypothetical protein